MDFQSSILRDTGLNVEAHYVLGQELGGSMK